MSKNIVSAKSSSAYLIVRPEKSSVSTRLEKRASRQCKDDQNEALVTIPPDGGWGWVVVFTAFTSFMCADGTTYSFGVFMEGISKSLDTSQSTVSLANSVLTGFYYLLGPVACAIVNRYGFRATAMLGGAISALAIGVSSFLSNTVAFIAVYGAVGGFGFCMIYVPSLMVVGFYFDKLRPIAISIAVCGSSAGVIAFPPLFKQLFCSLGWRNELRIISGLFCLCAFLALTYLPLQPIKVVPEDNKFRLYQLMNLESIPSFESVAEEDDQVTTEFCDQETTEQSSEIIIEETTREITAENENFADKTIKNVIEKNDEDIHKGSEQKVTEEFSNRFRNWRFSSASSVTTEVAVLVEAKRISFTSVSSVGSKTLGNYQSKAAVDGERLEILLEEDESNSRRKWAKFRDYCVKKCLCMSPTGEAVTAMRPMYRDDIFYSGSISVLRSEMSTSVRTSRVSSKLSKRSQVIDYHISVTRVATQKDLEEDFRHCICCPMAMKRTLATMLEFSLFKSPSFVMIMLSGFFTTLGMYTPFIYMSQFAVDKNIGDTISVYMISVLGVSNCVGRLACGLLSTLPHVGALRFSWISLTLCGGLTMGSVFLTEVYGMFTYAALFGMSIAALPSLRSIIIVEMMGLEKLTNAFGLVMMIQGVACLAGLPISGALIDYTGNYDACFLFAGSSIALSGLLLAPVKVIAQWEKQRYAKRLDKNRSRP